MATKKKTLTPPPPSPPVQLHPAMDGLLCPDQIMVGLGHISRRTFYTMIARGDFPKADVQLGVKLPRWSVGLFNRWIAERVAASNPRGGRG